MERIYMSGLLHDVGKIGVPEAVLQKPGTLTPEEFEQIKKHPQIGARILADVKQIEDLLPGVLYHHERYDGRGYPDGLKGDEIPYEVRMISIVDAYDALTSHRAYRPAPLTHTAALETLKREADAGKWDPILVTKFCEMLGGAPPDWTVIGKPVPTLHLN